jgi:hypothetical protein
MFSVPLVAIFMKMNKKPKVSEGRADHFSPFTPSSESRPFQVGVATLTLTGASLIFLWQIDRTDE